jgi:hypothetical protein
MDFAQRRTGQSTCSASVAFRGRSSALRESALTGHSEKSFENYETDSGDRNSNAENIEESDLVRVGTKPRAQALRGVTRAAHGPES